MQYFAFLLIVSSILFINGFAIVAASSAGRLSYRDILPSPIIGLCVLSIVVTALYRWGVAPHVTMLGATGLSITIITALWLLNRTAVKPAWILNGRNVIRCLGIAVVGFLMVLPHYLGGEQFAIFQGNRHDTLNYLSGAFGYANYSYSELAGDEAIRSSSAGLLEAGNMLSARPTVAMLYASFYKVLSRDFLVNAYDYCLVGQLNFYFAFLYLALWLNGHAERSAHVVAAAFTVGFFTQYIFDINAWSELFAVPMMMVLFTDYCRALLLLRSGLLGASAQIEGQETQRDAWQPRATVSFLVRLPILAAGLSYMYPEMVSVAGLACVSTLGFSLVKDIVSRKYQVALQLVSANAVFAAISLVLVGAYWKGTVGFLLQQLQIASKHSVDWHFFFQAYVFGGGKEVAVRIGASAGLDYWLYILLIAPANFLAGFFGLYFLQVWNIWARPIALTDVVWAGSLLIFFCTVIVAIASAVRSEFGRRDRGTQPPLFDLLAVGAIATFVIPLSLLARGQYWAAGKGLSMISPFVFAALTIPVLVARKNVVFAAVVSLVIAGHLLFGIARPTLITIRGDGLHYDYPYPSLSASVKNGADWGIGRYSGIIDKCTLIRVDVDEPFFQRAVQNYVLERKVPWFSKNRQNAYYGEGAELPPKAAPPGGREDCLITTNAAAGLDAQTSIVLDPRMVLNPTQILQAGQVISAQSGLHRVLGKGWSGVEPWGVWSGSKQAQLLLPLATKGFEQGVKLELSFNSFVQKDKPQRLRISLQGRTLGDWQFDESRPQRTVEIIIPASEISALTPTILDLATPDAVSPKDSGGVDDRSLAVGLVGIRVLEP